MNEDQLAQEIQKSLDYAHPNWPSGHWRKQSAKKQLTDLAVRFAEHREKAGMLTAAHHLAVTGNKDASERVLELVATLGEPEKTCVCTTSDGRYIRCDKHRTQWSSSNGGSPQ